MRFQVASRHKANAPKEALVDFKTLAELVEFCRPHGRVTFVKPGEKIDPPGLTLHDGPFTLLFFSNDHF